MTVLRFPSIVVKAEIVAQFFGPLIILASLLTSITLVRSVAATTLLRSTSQTGDLVAIIDGIEKKYSAMKGLAADFTQAYEGPDGQRVRERGHLLLKRSGKARWDYTEPEQKVFVSDGKYVYFYVSGERYASRTSVKKSGDPQIPFLFLLGRRDLKSEFSRIELLSDERAAFPGSRMLRLVPKRAPEEFKKLLVEVNPVSFEVRRLVILQRNGARMDFLLANVRENYVASDGEFSFTPPRGVTVRDQ